MDERRHATADSIREIHNNDTTVRINKILSLFIDQIVRTKRENQKNNTYQTICKFESKESCTQKSNEKVVIRTRWNTSSSFCENNLN